jgi:hypothetical protein
MEADIGSEKQATREPILCTREDVMFDEPLLATLTTARTGRH